MSLSNQRTGAAAAEPIIRFENVTKTFTGRGAEVHALRNVSLAVNPGDIFGVVGYSGAGKSTLLRTINGLEKPTSGAVIVAGKDVTSLSERQLSRERSQIGMIFQQFNLLQSRSVAGNVAYPLRRAGYSRAQRKERVAELLKFVGLSDKASSYPEQLSGGQKQRVGIARALATNPQVLISDEATSALDPRTTREVLDVLQRVNREFGITILLITHEMDVVRRICNRVAVMADGEVVEHGSVYDVFSRPATEISQHFVASVLDQRPNEETLQLIEVQHAGRLVELVIEDRDTSDPFLSRITRQHDVDFNIVYGGVNQLQSKLFGSLTIELQGTEGKVQAALDELRRHVTVRDVQESAAFVEAAEQLPTALPDSNGEQSLSASASAASHTLDQLRTTAGG